ncbi:MAG: sigma-70 family RNA polymerase sigma factor [Verrucomicrobiae bacterium]|nr:sigma-70 family RNA polymerase sigma factor [Verrucomicrobiae bacterium]
MENPSSQFVERLQRGDETAFAELVSRYRYPLISFCHRLLGDPHEAQDVVQEVFVRVCQHVGRYRPGNGRFSTWLFALARNACLDRLRAAQRRPSTPLEAVPEPITICRDVETHDLGELIATAVAQLPQAQRTALMLAEYHGLTHTEIATVLRCTKKSVETRLYRAKRILRKRLARLLDGASCRNFHA